MICVVCMKRTMKLMIVSGYQLYKLYRYHRYYYSQASVVFILPWFCTIDTKYENYMPSLVLRILS
jgi:hypothetical protein